MPMNWDRVRHEDNTRRYGKEDGTGTREAVPAFGAVRRRKRRGSKSMTPEEKRRWAEAVAKVYGKDS